jgi:hypothetical protein
MTIVGSERRAAPEIQLFAKTIGCFIADSLIVFVQQDDVRFFCAHSWLVLTVAIVSPRCDASAWTRWVRISS